MDIESIQFSGHRCFKGDWCGFEEIKAINVIIGRNNTGKSHLLDLVKSFSQEGKPLEGCKFRCVGRLSETVLMQQFPRHVSSGILRGNHWESHGAALVGARVRWTKNFNGRPTDLEFLDGFDYRSPFGDDSTKERLTCVANAVSNAKHPLANRKFRRVLADRDIRPEAAEVHLELGEDGSGATNIVRRFINTSNTAFPRELVQISLLEAMNQIFGQDGQFTEIQVKQHDEGSGEWEIYLGEPKKGLVALSNSGSGLKTVILVLLNLLVIPKIERTTAANFTFAFEELENNLHPALLRRLLQYVETFAVTENSPIFLTTHSSTALDLFGLSENAQIIHVTHDGQSAISHRVSAHFDHLNVVSELGLKPSDLLQANGIIWVEGPSDCVYVNRWIDLFTNNEIKEGRDYQCAFYGGSLLARTQFAAPEEAEAELINLFRVNPHIIVICDGDRNAKGARVKNRVRRIRSEVHRIPNAYIWVTQAREIENYLPGEVIAKAIGHTTAPNPGQYDVFFPRQRQTEPSYIEAKLNRKSLDKMELAVSSTAHTTLDLMNDRFDWSQQLEVIVEKVRSWNR